MDDSLAEAPSDDIAFPTLSREDVERVATYGRERRVAAGEALFAPGDERPACYVVLDGAVEIVHTEDGIDDVIARHGPGGFTGELGLLSGARSQLTARVAEAGRVIEVTPADLRRLLDRETALARTIVDALLARRSIMRSGGGARTLQILGSRFSPDTQRLRRYVTRLRLPHVWEDLEESPDVDAALARFGLRPDDTPVVVTPGAVLRRPTPETLAILLGLGYEAHDGEVFDMIVVGAGPAGLAAAVYGASEGIETLIVDAVGPGGQAGSSARIENYLGFPSGISGADLTERAAAQALKFGARLSGPSEVVALEIGYPLHVVRLADGTELACGTIVLATGARYRRPEIDGWSRFEGAGLYYAATDVEARTCDDLPVVVLGGGNSAGQAALFLAERAASVHLVARRAHLGETMSRYLVARIEAHDRIAVHAATTVRALHGGERLERVELEGPDGASSVACSGLFAFVGAEAATAWLPDDIALDPDGFVLTDRDVAPAHGARRPLAFETSVRGIFAVGDVRHGSSKRVAAAVGEGSSAVRSVHRRLQTRS
jgi:thioredoxin reductase (NADPH)